MLYAAELTWNSRKSMEGEYQAAINRMGRATLGALSPTPLGIVIVESALTPAMVLLDHRQACFAQQLLARPQGGRGFTRGGADRQRGYGQWRDRLWENVERKEWDL